MHTKINNQKIKEMKYNQFYKKDQETKKYLSADAFGSILGMDFYPTVVSPLPEMMTESKGIKWLQIPYSFIAKNTSEVHRTSNRAHIC